MAMIKTEVLNRSDKQQKCHSKKSDSYCEDFGKMRQNILFNSLFFTLFSTQKVSLKKSKAGIHYICDTSCIHHLYLYGPKMK